ncbi:MAG TPA: hypothetical protein VLF94_06235 [Chlamydiales bacterium]|nr:hypothetical protein [Chlamydiales bacterium]
MAALPERLPPRTAGEYLQTLRLLSNAKAPTPLEPLHDLDLPDLNIRIQNAATSRISVVAFQKPREAGEWWLRIKNEVSDGFFTIQEFIHKPELAVFQVVDNGLVAPNSLHLIRPSERPHPALPAPASEVEQPPSHP